MNDVLELFYLGGGHHNYGFRIPGNRQPEGAAPHTRKLQWHLFPGCQQHPGKENRSIATAPVNVFAGVPAQKAFYLHMKGRTFSGTDSHATGR